jgi:hypothetical protein
MTRHPVTSTGEKTQVVLDGPPQEPVGWRLFCDREGCDASSETRPTQHHLPLREFADAGWFIARLWGDTCPRCLAAGVKPTGAPMFTKEATA